MRVPNKTEEGAALVIVLVLALLVAGAALVWALSIHRSLDEEKAKVHAAEVANRSVQRARSLAVERARKQEEELLSLRGERAGLQRTRERLERENEISGVDLARERSLRLSQLSTNELDDDPALALRLAVDAADCAGTGAARSALLAALAARREIAAFSGVTDLLLTPDESRLVLRSEGKLLLVDPLTAVTLAAIADVDADGSMAISPDGKTLVATAKGVALAIIDFETFAVRHTIEVDSRVTDIAFDSTSSRVLLGTEDRAAWLFDLEIGKRIKVYIGHEGAVRRALFVDDETVATFAADNVLRFFDAASGERLREIQGSGRPERTRLLLAGPARRLLLIDEGNDTIDVVDTERGEIVYSVASRKAPETALNGGTVRWAVARSLALTTDGLGLLRISDDGKKVLNLDLAAEGRWEDFHDAGGGVVIQVDSRGFVIRDDRGIQGIRLDRSATPLHLPEDEKLTFFAFAGDDSLLAWGPGRVDRIDPGGERDSFRPGPGEIKRCLRPTGVGATIVLDDEGRLSWQADCSVHPERLLAAPQDRNIGPLLRLWPSADRSLLLASGPDGRARLVRLADGEVLLDIGEKDLVIAGAAFAARAPLLMVCLGRDPRQGDREAAPKSRLQVFDLEAMERVHDEELPGLQTSVGPWPGPDISADGKLVLVATDDGIKLRTWKDRSIEHELWVWGNPISLRFAQASALALVGGSRLALVDRFTGEEKELIESSYDGGHTNLLEGGKALINSNGEAIRVWDLETGKVRHLFGGETLRLDLLSIAPDSKTAVANRRGTGELRLLDLAAGTIGPAVATMSEPSFAAWSPDGDRVALAFESGQGLQVFRREQARPFLSLPGLDAVDLVFDDAGMRLLVLNSKGEVLRLAFDASALVAELGLEGLTTEERERFQLPSAASSR